MTASLGSTTYTTVTWTTGDIVTEAKLDNMVANDQAYDSHSAQGYLADNNKSFASKNNAGSSNLNLLKLNASDELVLGDTGVGLSATNLVKDEDDMASDSASHLATQQSIKAYVDSFLQHRDITQTNLASSFNAVTGTAEQEVTGLRVSLPVYASGTYTIKIFLKIYISTVAGNNSIRTRVGTSTSYLTNTQYDQLYVNGAKTVETLTGMVVLTGVDLSTQTYAVFSVQNDVDALNLAISATGARSTVVTEVIAE